LPQGANGAPFFNTTKHPTQKLVRFCSKAGQVYNKSWSGFEENQSRFWVKADQLLGWSKGESFNDLNNRELQKKQVPHSLLNTKSFCRGGFGRKIKVI